MSEGSKTLILAVKAQDNTLLKFKLNLDTPLETLMNHYSKRLVSVSTIAKTFISNSLLT